jgi:hypothetical protein
MNVSFAFSLRAIFPVELRAHDAHRVDDREALATCAGLVVRDLDIDRVRGAEERGAATRAVDVRSALLRLVRLACDDVADECDDRL